MRIPLLLLLLLLACVPAVQAQAVQARGGSAQDAAVVQAEPNEAAEGFLLTAAYPNPFNPSTQFTLTVAREQPVRVEVYNLLGYRVALLHDGVLTAQERHTFTFEADNLPSGLYLIRAAGEQFTSTQRVTLLK